MKTLRRYCAALTLALTLALSAFAGEMTTGFTTPPPPSSASAETTPGEMQAGSANGMSTTSSGADVNSVAGIALTLVQNVLALV